MNSITRIRLSCIIPTLGRGKVLLETIRMLLAQSHPAHEIIVVDQTPAPDAATRDTLAAWNKQGKLRWLRQREPNASKARNRGALLATGDFVLFLDDDIRLDSGFLAAYAETFARTGAPAVSGQVLEGAGRTVDTLPARASDPQIGWLYFRKNYSKPCETTFMMAGNAAINRTIFLELGGMDENYERGAHREETDFAARFIRAGYRFHFNPACSVYHLGPAVAPGGGARSWDDGRDFHYFHHCVGDWYFILGHARPQHLAGLLTASLRHFVLNHQTRARPYRLLPALAYWLAGLPFAVQKRLSGAKLLPRANLVPHNCT